VNIIDEEKNNDDTSGGEGSQDSTSRRSTCWSPGGQLPTMQKKHTDHDDYDDKNETIARLPQSNIVHCEKPLFGDNCIVRPSGQDRSIYTHKKKEH